MSDILDFKLFDVAKMVTEMFDNFLDWLYAKIIAFLSEFLALINGMGIEIFELDWVKALVEFFQLFGWAMFVVGLTLGFFETIIEMQSGKGNFKDFSLNAIKGFMAVNLFTITPITLYKFCIDIQGGLSQAMSGLFATPDSISTLGVSVIANFILPSGGALLQLFLVIAMGYSIIKVIFDNIKRAGILLIMIVFGSLYMFSIPRGYVDGFVSWSKQVAALCLTALIQSCVLIAGLLTINQNLIFGIGIIVAAKEVPRIAQNFGLETGTKINVMSTLYSAQSMYRMGASLASKIAK